MKKAIVFGFLLVVSLILHVEAQAACVPLTNLPLTAGGPGVHVSITDQACNVIAPAPLPNPTNITWSLVNASGFYTVVADATGFTFTGLAPLSSGTATPRYTSGTLSLIGAPTVITVSSSVTAIQAVQE